MMRTKYRLMDMRLSAFLILCLMLGGTSQDIVAPKLPLYILSLCVIAWGFIKLEDGDYIEKLKIPFLLLGLLFLTSLLYLIPLPPSIWTALPGRENIVQGFELLSMTPPWLPLSVTAETTLFSMFDFLPPFALLMMVGVFASRREIKLALRAVLIFAVFTVLLGVAQLSGMSESLYFYKFTNHGAAVGFFSNANHQASFLLMILPIAAVISVKSVQESLEDNFVTVLSMLAFFTLLIGVFLTSSIAGYGLAVYVLLATILLCVPNNGGKKKYFWAVSGIIITAVLLDFFFLSGYSEELLSEFSGAGHASRRVLFADTYQAIKDFSPLGSGLGSFDNVYRLYEHAGKNTIPHAHNDYLEAVLELGIFAIMLIVAFLTWLGKLSYKTVASHRSSSLFAKGAFVSASSVLIHSMVDYPLRNIGLSVLFTFFICLLILHKDVFRDKK